MSHTGTPDRRGAEPTPKKRSISVRISLFFDGTGNNQANIRERLANTPTYRRQTAADNSYEGEFSNVAWLERHILDQTQGFDEYVHVYTEGIGTTNFGDDDNKGYAIGDGPTGVVSKVTNGLATAIAQLFRKLSRQGFTPSTTILNEVVVDTCGFSRGAAAARHCVYRVFRTQGSLRQQLEGLGFEVTKVRVRAVGLFDTVSSFAPGWMALRHDDHFDNDVAELQLNAIRVAEAVYQLAAAEEYRVNFSLTDITSAGGRGTQVYLPGAHSDVGGGYRGGFAQSAAPLASGESAGPIADFLLTRGWYRGGVRGPQLTLRERTLRSDLLERTGGPVKNVVYPVIPLRLMAMWLRDQGLPLNPRLLRFYTSDKVPSGPQIEAAAKRGVAGEPGWWERVDAGLNELRYECLHVSFSLASAAYGTTTPHEARYDPVQKRPFRRVHPG